MSPRAFSEAERGVVRERLLSAAADHFARYGYRKANVAEIARDVGVAKGTLYLFVASKAELFLEVILAVEARTRASLLKEMERPFPSPRARLRHFLRFQAEALTEQPLLAVMVSPEEAAALMRDLPAGAMEDLRASDEAFYAAMAEEWRRDSQMAAVDPKVLAALPRALFALILQREIIGAEIFPEVIDLIIESMSESLAPGGDANETRP